MNSLLRVYRSKVSGPLVDVLKQVTVNSPQVFNIEESRERTFCKLSFAKTSQGLISSA